MATNSDVWVYDTRSDEVARLTDNSGSDLTPRWSPDGEQIAFVSNRDYPRDHAPPGWDLYVIGADGTNPLRLTETGVVGDPIWGPDGEVVAVYATRVVDRTTGYGLFRVDLSSGGVCKIVESLSPTLALDVRASSPDGRFLLVRAWTRNSREPEYSLQVIDLATGEAHVVDSRRGRRGNPSIQGGDWFIPAEP